MQEPPHDHVVVHGLRKRFGGVPAVRGVDLTIRRGQIHGLVGENGAGKTTLCRILAGATTRDGGEIVVNGRPVTYHSPKDALADGIALIAQEIALLSEQTVVTNVFLGNEQSRLGVVPAKALRRRYNALDAQVGFGIDPGRTVRQLVFGDQQKVEILRALARRSDLLILDEPTASLGPHESELLFRALRGLRDGGTTIVFISHNLQDVLTLCDTVTVLRDGAIVQTGPAEDETQESLIQAMLGRPMSTVFPPRRVPPVDDGTPAALSVHRLRRDGVFTDVSFEIRSGEIVGLAGLVGSGRSEVARAIFGVDQFSSGEVHLAGRRVRLGSARRAAASGLAMIPESRRDEGLLLTRDVEENLNLVHLGATTRFGVLDRGELHRRSAEMMQRLDIRAVSSRVPVGQLSGGNQQKVLFGKWLMSTPRILIADEPTRGVDIGAKRAIYELICELASSGVAVLLISSELEEILGLSHRVVVMRRGRITATLSGSEVTEAAVVAAAFAEHEALVETTGRHEAGVGVPQPARGGST